MAAPDTMTRSSGGTTVGERLRRLVATTLDVEPDELGPAVGLHDLPEWSSIDHVELMIEIETEFDVAIEGDAIGELTTMAAIEAFLAGDPTGTEPATGPEIHRGLDGVYVDTSAITDIDGTGGRLRIGGYAIETLAAHASFTDVAHLVLHGELPTAAERAEAEARLAAGAAIDGHVADLVTTLADRHALVAVRAALAMADRPPILDHRWAALDLVGEIGAVIATHHRARHHVRSGPAAEEAGCSAGRLLATCLGRAPLTAEVEAFDLTLRIGVDHGANASTFTARVVASTGADTVEAVGAAMAAFGGERHGGAVEALLRSVDEIGDPDRAAAHVAARRARREPVMGFGHRVYRRADPRVAPLRTGLQRLLDEPSIDAERRAEGRRGLAVVTALETAMAPYQRHGIHMNVDVYLGLLNRMLGFDPDHATALYAMARTVGWSAHIAEQRQRNVLIRPRLAYDGPAPRSLAPVADRPLVAGGVS